MKKFFSPIRRLAFFILACLCFSNSYCQKNFVKGFIVGQNGDTIHGEIDYRNWEINPKTINFNDISKGRIVQHSPMTIQSFSVNEEKYISAIISSENSSRNTNSLSDDYELILELDTTFLLTIIEGTKCLYVFKNRSNNPNFYIKEDNKYELLAYKIYKGKEDIHGKESNVKRENKKYINQLYNYLNDCPTLRNKLPEVAYKRKDIERIFSTYYNCSNEEMTYRLKSEKVKVEFGVIAGASYTSLKLTGDDYYDYLIDAETTNSINFSGGIFFDFLFPRNQRKWSVNNEFIYTSYLVESSYTKYIRENYYKDISTELGYAYIKMNNLIRFRQNFSSTQIFFNAGISNGIAVEETNYKKVETVTSTFQDVEEGKVLEVTRKYELGLLFGIGVKWEKVSTELRYEIGNGMSDYLNLKARTRRLFFFLGYKF